MLLKLYPKTLQIYLICLMAIGFGDFDDLFIRQNLYWKEYSKSIVKPSLDLYIEDYYDFGIANLNGTGPFTVPDGESYAINGNPSRWVSFRDHGFNISDRFFVGTSLHKLELNHEDVYIDKNHSIIAVSNVFDQGHYLGLDVGNGTFIYDDLSTARRIQELIFNQKGTHATERFGVDQEALLANRRHTKNHIEITQNHHLKMSKGDLLLKNLNQFGTRSFVNFNHSGITGRYDEDYTRLNLQLIWQPTSDSLLDQFHLRYSHLNRSHLFAEAYFSQNETANLEMDNLSFWWNLKQADYLGIHGLNISRKFIHKHQEHFAKNIIDQDGTGLEPWYPSMEVLEISQNNSGKYKLSLPFVDTGLIDWNFNQSLIHLRPLQESNFSAVFYQNTSTNLGLYLRQTKSTAFFTYLATIDTGVSFSKHFFDDFLHIDLGFKGVLDVMALRNKHLILPEIEYFLDLDLVKTRHFYTGFSFGQKSIPLSSELALFVSDDYDSGVFSYWNDDGDLVFENGENSGVVYRPTGGQYLELDPNLKHPNYIYFDWPIQVKVGKTFGASLTLSYKSYRNLFDVRWKNPANNYGHFDSVNSNSPGTKAFDGNQSTQQIYVLDRGADIKYVLSHDEDYPNLGTTFFTENPFYAGAYFEIVAKGRRYYASISFNAYIAMGRSGYGNGYLDNTLGSLSEEKANPNATIRTIGRVNNDNGYTGKIIVNGELFKGFWAGMVIKYRDGEAYSHYLTYLTNTGNGNQVAVWKRDVNGDTLLFPGGEFGTREDAFWNFDLNFIYNFKIKQTKFRVYFQVINALDIGAELVEKIFDPNRVALELQNPRGFRMGLFCKL